MSNIVPLDIFAFLGGLLPALLWLWFWFREDASRPEPRLLVAITFLAGMLAVYVALNLQKGVLQYILENYAMLGYFSKLPLYFSWAFIEETLKFLVVAILVLWRKTVNEPIDVMMYMIVVALGFAALENAYYIQNPLNETLLQSIQAGNLRFLGATLLHTLSSAVVGIILALAFFKSLRVKVVAAFVGVILATVLHALFNFFIIKYEGDATLLVFSVVWVGVILLILVFEGVKKMGRTSIRS